MQIRFAFAVYSFPSLHFFSAVPPYHNARTLGESRWAIKALVAVSARLLIDWFHIMTPCGSCGLSDTNRPPVMRSIKFTTLSNSLRLCEASRFYGWKLCHSLACQCNANFVRGSDMSTGILKILKQLQKFHVNFYQISH